VRVCFRIGERSSEEQPWDSFQSVMSATSLGFRKAEDLADSEIGIMMSPESAEIRQESTDACPSGAGALALHSWRFPSALTAESIAAPGADAPLLRTCRVSVPFGVMLRHIWLSK